MTDALNNTLKKSGDKSHGPNVMLVTRAGVDDGLDSVRGRKYIHDG